MNKIIADEFFNELMEKINKHIIKTKCNPIRIYLGIIEYNKVRSSNNAYLFYELKEEEEYFCGIPLYKVIKRNHIFIC